MTVKVFNYRIYLVASIIMMIFSLCIITFNTPMSIVSFLTSWCCMWASWISNEQCLNFYITSSIDEIIKNNLNELDDKEIKKIVLTELISSKYRKRKDLIIEWGVWAWMNAVIFYPIIAFVYLIILYNIYYD